MEVNYFPDANTLIYLGKATLLSGQPVLDSLLVPGRNLVITSTVLQEAVGNGGYPDAAVISAWSLSAVGRGRIIAEATSELPGQHNGL